MRIDLFNSAASEIASEQSAQQVNGKNAAAGQVDGEDRATLTSDTTSIGSLVSTAMNSPETRQGLVDSLKQSVSSGQYELDPGKIAASIIDDHA
jgi:flagellar biosynthesis anti-sigma factor FlgM